MDRQMIIITTDERQEKLASLLDGKKECCSWEEYQSDKDYCEMIYVLPTPVTKIDKNAEIKELLKQELINKREKNPCVFGGALNQEWVNFLEMNKITYFDFMKLSEVVEGNAYITAEATVAEVLQYSKYSITGQNILITGYGYCGKAIAKIFTALGAKVTVVARRAEVRERILADGYRTLAFDEMKDLIDQMQTVINTVPAKVITEDLIGQMSEEALIIDIASKPGGTDFDAAKKLGITAKLSLGLPGIYTTTSSAKILKDAIYKYAPLQDLEREGPLWIFQIVI